MTSGPVVVMVNETLFPLFHIFFTARKVVDILLWFMLLLFFLQVWEGHNVIQSSRTMVGHTNPAEAPAGTVRGDFSVHVSR